MNFTNTFLVSTKAIYTNKMRSFLTMLGVIIGVFSVVMLMSIGKGLEAYISDEFESLGTNNVFIFPGEMFSEESGGMNPRGQATNFTNNKLEIKDVEEIKKMRQYIEAVIPITMNDDNVSFRNKTEKATVIGTSYEFLSGMGSNIEKGRFFNQKEDRGSKKVVCLGFAIADELFGKADAVGKKVKIGSQTFRVVGVVEKQGGGGFGGQDDDEMIFIPLKKAFNLYDSKTIFEILVKVKKNISIEEAVKNIEKQMLKRLDEDEFSVVEQTQMLETITSILDILTIGLSGIAAISLLVGGIGIMNIMLVSVTERTREIGLRKALGATPNQILLQFLIESALLSVFGGLIGLLLAYGGSLLIQPYFPAKITTVSIILAFGVSTLVGVVFGASPANKASKLSPIEALRYE